jgi:SAM-dependent methyltransferase
MTGAGHEQNRRAWDERVRRRAPHTLPITREELDNPYAIIDDCGWLNGNVRGRRVLCLAAGGGRHGPLCAAAGAIVTVVDLSPATLALDEECARHYGLQLRTVEASMDDLSALGDSTFEVVLQPVSTCYVSDLRAVYREVARVTAPDGLYISQHKQPASLQAELRPAARGYVVSEPYFRTEPLPEMITECQHREAGTVEYLHRWQELVGGLCRAGFVLEDLVEPRHGRPGAEAGTFAHRSHYLPPFVTLKARRLGSGSADARPAEPVLWIPRS